MTHNETRISNARLAEMLAGLEGVTPGPWFVREYVVIGDKSPYRMVWDTDRKSMCVESVPAATAAHIARCDPDTIRAMIVELQALRSTPVEAEPVAWQHRGKRRRDKAFGGWRDGRNQSFETAEGHEFEERPLYAHPLPNPSPSDGEVSEAFEGSCVSCNGTGDLGGNPSYGVCPDCGGSGKSPYLQSKRGQP